VVAAELNTEGSKDVVIYKIRVADSTGEWTVSRRFRNFESLQRTLKELPGYRVRMPAKRVFTHSQNVEFVEERRHQLDQYLQQILADEALTGVFWVSELFSQPTNSTCYLHRLVADNRNSPNWKTRTDKCLHMI
jgi:hypothetical protein